MKQVFYHFVGNALFGSITYFVWNEFTDTFEGPESFIEFHEWNTLTYFFSSLFGFNKADYFWVSHWFLMIKKILSCFMYLFNLMN